MKSSTTLNQMPLDKEKLKTNKRKATLITGASSGIGFEFAHSIADKYDTDIILVARREDRLIKLTEILSKKIKSKNEDRSVYYFAADLSDEKQIKKLIKDISDKNLFVNLLINNAGFGSYGSFEETSLPRELAMVDLNIKAIVHLCHFFSKEMIEKKEGEIINVSSMASFQGLPYLAVYAATKAFVTSFSLALASELNQYNIKVQALCPGPVQTEFVNVSGFPDKISVLPSFSAHDVAELSLRKLKSSIWGNCGFSRIVIPGFMNIILAQLNRLLPRYLATDIAMKVLKKKFKK